MKQIAVIVLILSFLAQVFGRNIILLGYQVNKAAYLKKCENRYRPQMHCNGQCKLMKKLKEREKQEEKFPELKMNQKIEVSSYRSFFPACNCPEIKLACGIQRLPITCGQIIDRSFDIFHPPKV